MLRNSCASTILGVMFGLLGGALAAEEVAITNHSTAPWRLCRIPSEEVSVFHALPDPAFPEIVIDPGQTWLGGSSSPGTRQFLLKDAAGHHDAIAGHLPTHQLVACGAAPNLDTIGGQR